MSENGCSASSYGHGNAVQAEAKAEYQTLARALDIVCSGELGEATVYPAVYPACLFL